MLWLWYLMHSHQLAGKNSSRPIIFLHVGLGNNRSKHVLQTRRGPRRLWGVTLTLTHTEQFPQDPPCTFNINTPSAFSLPSRLLQCQHCTEGYLSKETQCIPLYVSKKAFQLWVRSDWDILSCGEPEARVFALSQTLRGSGNEGQVRAECLTPEEERWYSNATAPLQRLKHLTKVVLKIKTGAQCFHLTGDRESWCRFTARLPNK